MKPRIEPLDPPYDPAVAKELAAMMPPGVEPLKLFRTLARNERVLGKVRASNLLDRGSLERRDRELVILRTCARCRSEYEWGVHVAVFAARVGLDESAVRATVLGAADDPAFDARQRALVRTVDELHDGATLSDAAYRDLATHFSEEQIVELLVLTGFYHTISFVTNALAIEHEPTAARFPQ